MKTIIEMAEKAFETPGVEPAFRNGFWTVTSEELERFAELVRADERDAMVAEAAKKGWAMRGEDPFEECVREIAAIRARGNT